MVVDLVCLIVALDVSSRSRKSSMAEMVAVEFEVLCQGSRLSILEDWLLVDC